MASTSQEASMRKPSGSSTRSAGQSPSSSPSHGHAHTMLPQAGSNAFGMGHTAALKNLSAGWQVWETSAPSPRNVSTSSATSLPDQSGTHLDAAYRGNLGQSWGSRSTSGNWDEMAGSAQFQDLSIHESHSALPLHASRQRQGATSQGGMHPTAASAGSKAGQFSQFYDTSAAQRGASSPSGNYDPENELTSALRGMVVADDLGLSQQDQAYRQSSGQAQHTAGAQARALQNPQQSRGAYLGYPGAEYAGYYAGPSARVDYRYGYDAYRAGHDPAVYLSSSPALSHAAPNIYAGLGPQPMQHPHSMSDIHNQQSGIYYDYPGTTRTIASQYYYPTQPIVFPHPAHSPVNRPHNMAKKRDSQHHQRQQPRLLQNAPYSGMHPASSPISPSFPSPVDYSSQHAYGSRGMYTGMPTAVPFHSGGRRRFEVQGLFPVVRSPILDDFRANKSRKWELKDIFGYVVEFSADQHGSRFIQQKLESATPEEKQKVFDEIVPQNALYLIQDVFGNYVIQKLFEQATPAQRTLLAKTMEGHVLPLSLQMYGCRVVQKAVEYISPEQQGIFVRELSASVLVCVKDANGNHVVQKLVECLLPEHLSLIDAFRGHVYELSTHPYGCRVLQRCFEHVSEERTRPLLDELHKHVSNLMQDQFGNYVIQFVLEHGNEHDRSVIVSKLQGHLLSMARHKFASNVCEKALVTADSENRRLLIEEILTARQDGSSPLVTMMKDQFANYVLQRALAVAEPEQRELLVNKIKPHLLNMRRYSSSHTKHLAAIERLLEKCESAPHETADAQDSPAEFSDNTLTHA